MKRHKWITDEHSEQRTRKHCVNCGRHSDREGRWSAPLYWTAPDLTNTSWYEEHCNGRQANGC